MRSLVVVVMYKLIKAPVNAHSTAHPRHMEAVDTHLERVKRFLDEVSITVVELTAQPSPRQGSQIAEAIDEKHGLGEILFLVQSMQKRRCWIRARRPNSATSSNNFVSMSIVAYTHDHSPVILTAVSSTATRIGCADGGSETLSATRCTH